MIGQKKFTFIYMPDNHSRVREVRVSSVTIALSAAGLAMLALMALLYVAGLWQGYSWLPGGHGLTRQDPALAADISGIEQRIELLQADLDEVFRLQEMLSVAVDLDPLDPTVWEAGVGGRAPQRGPLAVGNLDDDPARLLVLEERLAKLLRQASIQRQGYHVLLDTLQARAEARDHLPSIRPVDIGWLSSGFGKRPDPFTGKLTYHHGLDFSVPAGTPVRATAAGTVTSVKHERGFGRSIVIDHGNKTTTLYAHLSRTLVKKGQQVKRGDIIAESGKSGRCTAPHLHYEVRLNDRRVNPLSFILDSYAAR